MSEQNEFASDPCESSEDPGGTGLLAEEGGTSVSRRLEAKKGNRRLSAEEEAEILERLRALGYL